MFQAFLEELFNLIFRGILRGIGTFVWWLFAACRPRYRDMFSNEDYDFRHTLTGFMLLVFTILAIIVIKFS